MPQHSETSTHYKIPPWNIWLDFFPAALSVIYFLTQSSYYSNPQWPYRYLYIRLLNRIVLNRIVSYRRAAAPKSLLIDRAFHRTQSCLSSTPPLLIILYLKLIWFVSLLFLCLPESFQYAQDGVSGHEVSPRSWVAPRCPWSGGGDTLYSPWSL